MLEVDISILDDLHDRLSNLPPAPFSQTPPRSKQKKFVVDVGGEASLCYHSALLKFYVEVLGVKFECLHRAVGFSWSQCFGITSRGTQRSGQQPQTSSQKIITN